jgi:hypothetical protein
MATPHDGRKTRSPHVGGLDQPATAQRFRSTPIRLPNQIVKPCTVLEANTYRQKLSIPQNRLHFSTHTHSTQRCC